MRALHIQPIAYHPGQRALHAVSYCGCYQEGLVSSQLRTYRGCPACVSTPCCKAFCGPVVISNAVYKSLQTKARLALRSIAYMKRDGRYCQDGRYNYLCLSRGLVVETDRLPRLDCQISRSDRYRKARYGQSRWPAGSIGLQAV